MALAPRAEPALPAVRRVLARYTDAIDANWDGTLAGVDPEFLHRLRVAIRRTRTTLATTKGVIDAKQRRTFARSLRRIAVATNDARDYDVAVLDWPARVAQLGEESRVALAPIEDELLARRQAAHVLLNRELNRRRTRRFVKTWRRWLAQEPKRHGRRSGVTVGKTIERLHRKLAARIARLEGVDSAEARHDLRKNVKRLRYVVDGFAALYDDDDRKALLDRLVAMQDDLGRGRDAMMQAQLVRSISAELPATAETQRAVGELVAGLVGRG